MWHDDTSFNQTIEEMKQVKGDFYRVSGALFNEHKAHAMVSAFSPNTKAFMLSFDNCESSGKGFDLLFKGLAKNKYPSVISISITKSDIDSFAFIPDMLSAFPNLKSLTLTKSNVKDKDLLAVAPSISASSLRELNVEFADNVTDKSLDKYLSMIKSPLVKLLKVDCASSSASDEMRRSLEKATEAKPIRIVKQNALNALRNNNSLIRHINNRGRGNS